MSGRGYSKNSERQVTRYDWSVKRVVSASELPVFPARAREDKSERVHLIFKTIFSDVIEMNSSALGLGVRLEDC